MGIFKASSEEKAEAKAEYDAKVADRSRRGFELKQKRDGERRAEWQRSVPEGADLPYVERMQIESTPDGYAAIATYIAAVGLRPEDVYGIALERGSDTGSSNGPQGVAVFYRDSPAYASARDEWWRAHPERVPMVIVEGSAKEEDWVPIN